MKKTIFLLLFITLSFYSCSNKKEDLINNQSNDIGRFQAIVNGQDEQIINVIDTKNGTIYRVLSIDGNKESIITYNPIDSTKNQNVK